jgi:predicted lipoprotein with Yx(FWY)xxD motif
MKRICVLVGVGMVGMLFLAACGDSGSSSSTTTTAAATTAGGVTTTVATTTTATPTTTAAATTAATGGTVIVTTNPTLGKILTDDKGRTLYSFAKDTKNTSTCTGTCATTWPAYTPTEIKAGAGIDATKLSSIDANGKKQVTIDGIPLYYFSGDSAAGDTKGQGFGGNWYVVDATGKAIK